MTIDTIVIQNGPIYNRFEGTLANKISENFAEGFRQGKILVRTANSLHNGDDTYGRGKKMEQVDLATRVAKAVACLKGIPDDNYVLVDGHNRKFMRMAVRIGMMDDIGRISWPVLDALTFVVHEWPETAKYFDLERLDWLLPKIVNDTIAPVMVLAETMVYRPAHQRLAEQKDTEWWLYAFTQDTAESIRADLQDTQPSMNFKEKCWNLFDHLTMHSITADRLHELTRECEKDPEVPLSMTNAVGAAARYLGNYELSLSQKDVVEHIDFRAYFGVIGSQRVDGMWLREVTDVSSVNFIQDLVSGTDKSEIYSKLKRFKVSGLYGDYSKIPTTPEENRAVRAWLKREHGVYDGLRRAPVLEADIEAHWVTSSDGTVEFDLNKVTEEEISKEGLKELLGEEGKPSNVFDVRLIFTKNSTMPLNLLTKPVFGSDGELEKVLKPGILGYMGKPGWMAVNFQDGLPMHGFLSSMTEQRLLGQNKMMAVSDDANVVDKAYGLSVSMIRFHKSRLDGSSMVQLFHERAAVYGVAYSRYYGTYLFEHFFNEKCDGLAHVLAKYSASLKLERNTGLPIAAFFSYKNDFRLLITDREGNQRHLRVLG